MEEASKKLNIAIVSDAIYPYNIGGKEKRIYELTTRLVKRGHKVTIYTMKWWKGKSNRVEHEGVIHEAISPLYPLYSGERRSIKEAIMFSLNCFKLLNKKFDVVEVDHMPQLVLFPMKFVCVVKQKKFFGSWHEVWGRKYWVKYLGLRGNIAYIIEWLSTHLPDEIISGSTHTTRKLKSDLGVNIPVHNIPLGIDFEDINNVEASTIKSDVISAGRLIKHKNIDVLIKAISLLKIKFPNIRLIVVGNGPEQDNLKRLAKELNLENNIKFYDFMERHSDLWSLMKSSKVFAYPTIREGFGLSSIEANACGLPVITTNHKDNGAKDQIINNKNGQIIELSESNLANSIEFYLLNKSSKETYINIAKDSDWDRIVLSIERIFS